MKYGMVLPGGTATEQLEQAMIAEEAGWDGVFVWEAAYGVDAWTLLGAIAGRTTRVMLGTLLTPLPWRRPWKVASQAVTLDQLSGGRAILTVGLGALGTELPSTGEVTDLKERAQLLDEGMDLMRVLWEGGSSYHSPHYDYECERDDLMRAARSVRERIPIWVVAVWPGPRSMQRVLRCDGVVPQYRPDDQEGSPDDVVALRAWLAARGARADLDVIAQGESPADDRGAAAAQVAPWAEAGCTWWLETRWGETSDADSKMTRVRERLAAGPPTT
jgi:alkanesulfonate monooxygenase SsuD/methylene tetrahydromethanopterin reductase-like flavin-dependent oxidoreductase (luciferase family)